MIKTQYSRVINKRTATAGAVPVIGPSADHTDGSWTGDTMIYPGDFFINMEDQKVWFGWTSGSTSGTTMIYPPPGPGGGLTIVGGTGIGVSGASPDFSIAFNGNTTEFSGLTSGTEFFQLAASQTQEIIIIPNVIEGAAYTRFCLSAIEETTFNGAVFESFCGQYNSDIVNGWLSIATCFVNTEDDIGFSPVPAFTQNGNGDLIVSVTQPAGTNTINYRIYWEYSEVN